MADSKFRIERDSLGIVEVPETAAWGPQTQRAVENFRLSGVAMPRRFIRALGLVKWAAARSNAELGLLDPGIAGAIADAAMRVMRGELDTQFPVDIFQTGSGTSSNMNANEVIARLASDALGQQIHANDHVNMCQSSNDVIPTTIHVAAILSWSERLGPALGRLSAALARHESQFADIVKTGRTHLMDALPLTLGQEISAWRSQVDACAARLQDCLPRLRQLALGATAVGTGANADPRFAETATTFMARQTGIDFRVSDNAFASLAGQDTAVELSGHLRTLAVALTKLCNDLRWMNSGPLTGLAELGLPELQPGSSIMPGKVNPVIPEAVAMVCAQVMGNDVTITVAGQSGNFQLNVMLPVIAANLEQSMELLANGCDALAENAIAGLAPNRERIAEQVSRNPILATALNPLIGYDRAAEIAKRAYREKRAVFDVAREMTEIDDNELRRLLDPLRMTRNEE
jgi:fumarate hydratase class II